MSSKKLKEKKELEAQKKREDALKYLSEQGQTVKSHQEILQNMVRNGSNNASDNTLELLLKQSAESALTSKQFEKSAKEKLLQQQMAGRKEREDQMLTVEKNNNNNGPLPKNWQKVVDPTSNKDYYWNVVTNETSWEKPQSEEIPLVKSVTKELILPFPWKEMVHPATKQKYFFNTETKVSSATNPLELASQNVSATTKTIEKSSIKNDLSVENSNKRMKFDKDVDPLDPMQGKGKGNGVGTIGKMADSTASGALWQQRPYPAPGKALRPNEGKSVGPLLKR